MTGHDQPQLTVDVGHPQLRVSLDGEHASLDQDAFENLFATDVAHL